MTTEEKEKITEEIILRIIINCEIGSYMTLYSPNKAVISISNILELTPGITKYRARKALKALLKEGLIEYTSQGCPAVISYGECPELVCEAGPPINGYCLTKKGFESEEWKAAYKAWCKSMEEWTNGSAEEM